MATPLLPIEALWQPSPGVDSAAREASEHRLRTLTTLGARAEGHAGLFATEALPAGVELIHRWHDGYYEGMVGWRRYSTDEIEVMEPEHQASVLRYGLDADFGFIYGPVSAAAVITWDNFINHGCAPNLGYDVRGSVVTLRPIAKGEELTLDYGEFVVNYDEPFTCFCGAPRCRGGVTREDWRRVPLDRPLPPYLERARRGG